MSFSVTLMELQYVAWTVVLFEDIFTGERVLERTVNTRQPEEMSCDFCPLDTVVSIQLNHLTFLHWLLFVNIEIQEH